MGQTRLCVALHSKACSLFPEGRAYPKGGDGGVETTAHDMLFSETAACWRGLVRGQVNKATLFANPTTTNF